jgi:hypothetical protein
MTDTESLKYQRCTIAIPYPSRNECHQLMMAIDGNKLSLIEECAARIQQVAHDALGQSC